MIIINYLVAAILGIIIQPLSFEPTKIIDASWLPITVIIGFLFVFMFFLIGWSTEKAGIVVTSIATRMSMIIPITFSIFLFDEEIYFSKIIKIFLTLIAVILAIYRKPEKNIRGIYTFLPFVLFIGSGSVDALVKTAQHWFIPANEIELFTSSLFGISFLASLLLFFNKKKEEQFFAPNSVAFGILLGVFNFGSLFFLIKALSNSGVESSLIFGINNLTIVCLTLVIGAFLFKEKLSKINWIGIAFSIICVIILIRF